MNRAWKILALSAAGVLLTNSIKPDMTFIRPQKTKRNTVSAFAERIMNAETPSVPFCSLRFSERDQQLYRDGVPVGQEYAECSVRNGSLVISADGEDSLTPQEAAERIGCEVTAENGDLTIRFPFRTARLIVKSGQEPKLYGGRLLAADYRDLYVVQYNSQREAYLAYQAYRQDPDICYADCDRFLSAAEVQTGQSAERSEICGTAEIGADAFCEWLRSEKDELPEIRVAVIDSGIYAEHTWLAGRVLGDGANFCSGLSEDASDDNGHGTHCAGIIASGTPDSVRLLPVKVLDHSGYGSLLSIYCGMMYALEQNADVINLSLGGYGESPLLDEAVDAIAEADIPLCTAAGNDQKNVRYVYPACSDKVITVSAVDRQHEIAEFSNYGQTIDFAAPGVGIVSSVTGSPAALGEESGTSMATPFVTAAVADLLSYDPALTNRQIYDNLRSNAIDRGEPGFDEQYGWGEISLRDFHFTNAFCRPPVIHPAGGNFRGAVYVTLGIDFDAEDQAEIYYTTDGSEPDPDTALRYTGSPVLLEHSARLKAVTVNGNAKSRTASADFCIDREDVAEPFVIRDGVLSAYLGIRTDPDLTALNGTVTAVGEGAFAGCTGLRRVTLPESVTAIGARAFSGCTSLTEITGSSVSAVGEAAFSGCTSLERAVFQPLSQIGRSAFRDCGALRAVENGLSEEVNGIPEHAFRGCALLGELSMPAVTEIGDYAFAGCKKLRIREGWEAFESVGEHAFEHAGLTGAVRLLSLRSLGAYAFADNAIGEIVFPDTLTVLPEGVCKDNSKLRKITANGAAELGAYALQQTSPVPVAADMDFGSITALGSAALDGIRFAEPVVFTRLRTAEAGALDGIQGPGFYFPAVTSLGAGSVTHAEHAVLYFENLVSVQTGAVKNVRALIVGGKLETAEPDSVSAELLAGPADSVLAEYAAQSRGNYHATPCLLTDQKTRNVHTGETVQFRALPLGFGELHVRWLDENGSMLLDDSTGMFQTEYPNTGKYTYRAVLYQGDTEADSAEFRVYAAKNTAAAAELSMDETAVVDLRRAIADGTAVTSDGHSYHVTYRYHAAESGTCQMLLTGDFNNLVILDSTGTQIPHEWEPSAAGRNAVFVVRSGASYLIELSIPYSPYQMNSPVCALRLTGRDLSELTPLTDPDITLQKDDTSEYVWQGDPVVPERIRLQQGQGSASAVLNEGEDYIIYCTDNNAAGFAVCWLIGIGNYCGSLSFSYQIICILQEGKPVVTSSSMYEACYDFTPEEDGDYVIFPDITDAWIAEQQANKCFDSRYWNFEAGVSVHAVGDDDASPLRDPDYAGRSFTEDFTYTLRRGVKYRIILTRSSAEYQPQRSICVERGVQRIEDYCFSFEGESNEGEPEEVLLTSDSFEPEITCESSLTEGKDYKVTYIANDHAGEMVAVIQGIGRLRGTTWLTCQLIEDLKLNESVSVHPADEYTPAGYRFIPEVSGTYTFWTDYSGALVAEAERTGRYDPECFAAEPETELTLFSEDAGRLRYSTADVPGRFTAIEYDLTAGNTYRINAGSRNLSDFELYVEKGAHSILDAAVSYQKTVSMNEAGTNPVTVTAGDEVLTAGTDYTVTLLDGGNGQYLYLLKGTGDYCGSVYCPVTVTDGAAEQILEPGVPFTQSRVSADYRLELTEAAVLRLRPADQSEQPFYAALTDEAEPDTVRHFDSDTVNLSLPAGSYTITLEQESGTERSYVFEILGTFYALADCTAEVQNTVFTGQAVHPAVSVSFRDRRTGKLTQLKEGRDFRIAGQNEWKVPGQYHVRLTGLGSYYGDKLVSFCIIPDDPETLPLLTDGEHTAGITVPGGTVLYRWDPQQKSCIVSDMIRNRRFSFYAGTELVAEYSGSGYQFFVPDTQPGVPCVAAVSFCNASETGEIGFQVKSDFKELALCQTEIEQAVPYDPEGRVPAYTVRDGHTALKEGTDYDVLYVGGETHCGTAVIALRGKGRYVGECRLNFCVYPEDVSSIPADEILIQKEIGLRETAEFKFEMPGDAALFTFTAQEDGTYYLVNDNTPEDAVSVFVYLPDGSLMPVHRTEIQLSEQEQIRILAINNWVSTKTAAEGSLYITLYAPSYIWTDETSGITYYVQGDSAVITAVETDDTGVVLPDQIIDPETRNIKDITGIHPDVLRDSAGQKTFYLTPGGSAERNLASENELCYAYAYPESAMPGDVTGTGGVDRNDALTLLRILTECKGMMLCGSAAEAADCNGDGSIDMLDVQAILLMCQSGA